MSFSSGGVGKCRRDEGEGGDGTLSSIEFRFAIPLHTIFASPDVNVSAAGVSVSRPILSPFLLFHLCNLSHERLKHPKRVRLSVCHVIFVGFPGDCAVEWDE